MKSLTSLWSCIAREMAMRCRTSATHDIKTVVSRTEDEGLWFLAITLANFGKATQKWLDQGFVDHATELHGKWKFRVGRPVFLRGFLDRVFDPVSGALLDDPDIEAIFAIRQLTLMFSKIALPEGPDKGSFMGGNGRKVVTPQRERLAMSEYVQCEQDVKAADDRLDPQFIEDFKRMSSVLFGELFDRIEESILFGHLIPKHGPGAVADRLSSNAKWNQRTWTTRLQRVMPAEEFLVPNQHYHADLDEELNILEPGSEFPVRVIAVPKSLQTPRIIAIEPAAMQYAQQAVLGVILDEVRKDGFLSQVLGFDDQDPNRIMARRGSHSGDLATLDLSEASDRVSSQHVRALFHNHPLLLEVIDATRSRMADVPGHGVLRLAKYASMGSALCFPMEAMVFLTLIFLGIERELSAPLSRATLVKGYREQVRVFGDDIIVPRDYVLSVVNELDVFGHRVNIGKSFWTGRFRESCGREFYDGHDVSIVKVRRMLPTRRQDASGVISAVALRNQLYWAGLWKGAAWMDKLLMGMLKHFPNVAPSSPLLGRESCLGYQFQTLHPYHHSPLTKGYVVMAEPPRDPLEGSGALLKCLLRADRDTILYGMCQNWHGIDTSLHQNGEIASVDAEHLERSGRPKSVGIKLGMALPY